MIRSFANAWKVHAAFVNESQAIIIIFLIANACVRIEHRRHFFAVERRTADAWKLRCSNRPIVNGDHVQSDGWIEKMIRYFVGIHQVGRLNERCV